MVTRWIGYSLSLSLSLSLRKMLYSLKISQLVNHVYIQRGLDDVCTFPASWSSYFNNSLHVLTECSTELKRHLMELNSTECRGQIWRSMPYHAVVMTILWLVHLKPQNGISIFRWVIGFGSSPCSVETIDVFHSPLNGPL